MVAENLALKVFPLNFKNEPYFILQEYWTVFKLVVFMERTKRLIIAMQIVILEAKVIMVEN